MGFYQLDVDVGYQTVGVSVVNPALFGSWIGSSSASTITSTDPTVDVGSLLDVGAFPNAPKAYYVEIVEGPTGTSDALVGQRFEVAVTTTIDSGTANGVIALEMDAEMTTWENTPPANPTTAPDLTGYRFELRAHVTIGQIFDPFSLYGSTSFANADQVQFFRGSGFEIYYLLGNNDTVAYWTRLVGGNFESFDDQPIPPGTGLIYKRSSLSADTSLRVQGMARVTPFVQPMASGFNFVSEAFPISTSFDSRDAYPGDFNNEDRVQVYNGVGFTTYKLLSDGVATHRWVNAVIGFDSQNAMEIFDYRGAVFVDLDTPTSDYRIDPPYPPEAP